MAYIGVTTRKGTCAICAKSLPKGTHVYVDLTKTQGKHLVHQECWKTLLAERGPLDKKGKKSGEILSTEKLDPPF